MQVSSGLSLSCSSPGALCSPAPSGLPPSPSQSSLPISWARGGGMGL